MHGGVLEIQSSLHFCDTKIEAMFHRGLKLLQEGVVLVQSYLNNVYLRYILKFREGENLFACETYTFIFKISVIGKGKQSNSSVCILNTLKVLDLYINVWNDEGILAVNLWSRTSNGSSSPYVYPSHYYLFITSTYNKKKSSMCISCNWVPFPTNSKLLIQGM